LLEGPMSADEQQGLDLGQLLAALARQKWTIVAGAAAGLLLAIAYLHIVQPEYRVTLSVMSTRSDPFGGNARMGGLASIVGARLGNEQADNFTLYREGVHSLLAAETLAQDRDLMRMVFAHEIDPSGGWAEPRGLLRDATRGLGSVLGVPMAPWAAPNPLRLRAFLQREVSTAFDEDSGVLSLSIDRVNPAEGEVILRKLDQAVDAVVRARQLNRAEQYAAYIREQLEVAPVPEQRAALAAILLQQEQQIMMARVTLPFAAESFGSPVPSLGPAKPNGPLMLGVGLVAGAFLGLLVALSRERLLSR